MKKSLPSYFYLGNTVSALDIIDVIMESTPADESQLRSLSGCDLEDFFNKEFKKNKIAVLYIGNGDFSITRS